MALLYKKVNNKKEKSKTEEIHCPCYWTTLILRRSGDFRNQTHHYLEYYFEDVNNDITFYRWKSIHVAEKTSSPKNEYQSIFQYSEFLVTAYGEFWWNLLEKSEKYLEGIINLAVAEGHPVMSFSLVSLYNTLPPFHYITHHVPGQWHWNTMKRTFHFQQCLLVATPVGPDMECLYGEKVPHHPRDFRR